MFYKIKNSLKFYTITFVKEFIYLDVINDYKPLVTKEQIFASNEYEAINIFNIINPDLTETLISIKNNRTGKIKYFDQIKARK